MHVPQDGSAQAGDLEQCDVLVVGGGPAGTTAASMLAIRGWSVVLLEKDHHPRFHIGESLLPMNLPIFERLGILDQVRAIGVPKFGAEFNALDGARQTYYFANAVGASPPMAFQVRRAEFDALLFRRSTELGVDTRQGVRVTSVGFEGSDGVTIEARNEKGPVRFRARYLVDASGRDTLLATKFASKRKNRDHQTAAMYSHFQGVALREGKDAGNISIYWFEHGWIWMIPLRDDTVSVGVVCGPSYLRQRRGSPENFFSDTLDACPEVAARLCGAQRVQPVRATANYSYTSDHACGSRYVMIGDAYAFVDPVFSSGVFLAMHSACRASEMVDCSLREPRSEQALQRTYEQDFRRGIRRFSWFIYRFNSPALRTMFMSRRDVFKVKAAVVSVLAGDVHRAAGAIRGRYLFRLLYRFAQLAILSKVLDEWRARRRDAAEHVE